MENMANLNLRDLYVYVGEKIYNWTGYKTISGVSEFAAYNEVNNLDGPRSKLFFGGSNLLNMDIRDEDTINIIISGLRGYFDKPKTEDEEMLRLFCSVKESPEFYDISNYDSIKDNNNFELYQLIGDITPYDVLYMSGKQFKEATKRGLPIIFEVNEAVTIRILYDKSDSYISTSDSTWDERVSRMGSISSFSIDSINTNDNIIY